MLTSLLSLMIATPAAAGASDHDAVLRDRIGDVRELLDRRQAHRRMLSGQIEALSLDLDRLRSERETALAALADMADRARADERELDRLMPRLLPRLNTLDSLRKQGARAIAELARASRAAPLEDRTRARLLATAPIPIEQLRLASTSVRLLRRLPSQLAARHRNRNFQIPLLAAAADQLSIRLDDLQRRRDGTIRALAELSGEIDRLTAEEHRLARNMLARTLSAAADPGGAAASLARWPAAGAGLAGEAAIQGSAVLRRQPRPAALPSDKVAVEAAPSAASLEAALPALSADAKASVAARAQPDAAWPAPGRVAALQAGTLDSLAARVERRHLNDDPPLVPSSQTISYTLADALLGRDQPAIEIPAKPRQLVAAPDDGRVVFADDFRSYGLLLIIEHDSEYHTLLWGFSSLDIELGDRVLAGQILGTVGAGQSPKLHVELRRNGRPVSPEVWLAASNSGVKG